MPPRAKKVHHHLVYALDVEKDGEAWMYIGVTGVLDGQTDRQAIEARKRYHISHPVHCLKGFDPKSASIRVMKSGLTELTAYLDEASRLGKGHFLVF